MSKFSMVDKLNLARTPTPIERLPKLSALASKFAEVEIAVKRDDLTHVIATGNKIRKLELHFAAAKKRGARVVFTCGATQSNHARATAVLSRQLGLECVLFLRDEGTSRQLTGNLLLDALFGADIRFITPEQFERIDIVFAEAAEVFKKRDGISPFFIAEGGSDDIGGMGYALAYEEIAGQVPYPFDSIVVANGSGGTQAGLILGKTVFEHENTKIVGFNVCKTAPEMAAKTKKVALSTIQRHRLPISFMPADIHIIDGYVTPGYAKASPQLYNFIVQACRADGILLDPVYTGKALYGLIQELTASRQRAEYFGKKILFVHTGGFPSIFAHENEIEKALHG